MNYNISFDIVAVAIDIILLLSFGHIRKYSFPVYKAYISMVLVSLLTATLDLLTIPTLTMTESFPLPVVYTINTLYFMFQSLVIATFARYVFLVANVRVNTIFRKIILGAPYLLSAILIITSPFLHTVFYFDEELNYVFGELHWIIYYNAAIYILTCIVTLIKYRSSIKKKSIIVLLGQCVLNIVFVAAQAIFPEQLLMSFATSICLYIVIFSIESPKSLLDNTNSMRMESFLNITKSAYKANSSFGIIIVSIKNTKVLRNLLTNDRMDSLYTLVTDFLYSQDKDAIICRKGNGTFLFKTDKKENTAQYLEAIRQRFELVWKKDDLEMNFSAGFGYISCPEDAENTEELTELIEILSNSVTDGNVMYASNIGDRTRRREVLRAVVEAITEKTFKVFYQPIYSVDRHSITAAEALIRLFDSKLGFVPPDEFIPIAEKEGYILQIGEFVLEEVCRFYSENKLHEKGIEYIEVNLSVIQCMQHSINDRYLSILEKYGMKPEQVNFEITETSAIISYDAVKRNINDFRKSGYTISLDDYGTGYSNISYLYSIPFDYIKIDKSILWGAQKNSKILTVLENTIQMAKKLNMKIITEGIENKEHALMLTNLGCDYFQGFFYSKAVNEEDFIKYIDSFNAADY